MHKRERSETYKVNNMILVLVRAAIHEDMGQLRTIIIYIEQGSCLTNAAVHHVLMFTSSINWKVRGVPLY